MPLKINQVRGRPMGLYGRVLALGLELPPAPVTISVAAAGAAAGSNTIPVEALTVPLPVNTVLMFERAGGDPLQVVVNEDAEIGATSLSVEMFEGVEGEGLSGDLAEDDEAVWDQLYTVDGTENSPYTNNPTTQDLNSVTYGAATGVSVGTPEVQSIAPQIARTGLFIAGGPLTKDILEYADSNRKWWFSQVTPKADGSPYMTRAGLAIVTDLNQDPPANDLIRLSFNIRFVASKPANTFH